MRHVMLQFIGTDKGEQIMKFKDAVSKGIANIVTICYTASVVKYKPNRKRKVNAKTFC